MFITRIHRRMLAIVALITAIAAVASLAVVLAPQPAAAQGFVDYATVFAQVNYATGTVEVITNGNIGPNFAATKLDAKAKLIDGGAQIDFDVEGNSPLPVHGAIAISPDASVIPCWLERLNMHSRPQGNGGYDVNASFTSIMPLAEGQTEFTFVIALIAGNVQM